MFVGIIATKLHMMDQHSRSSLSDITLFIFLPCNILSSFFSTESSQLPSMGKIFMISMGIMMLSGVLSPLLYKRVNPQQKKVVLYATLISNAGFLGNPVIESIYGLEGLPYVAAYLLPLRVAVWTVGLAVFTGGKGNLKKVIFHPCLIATYLGFLIIVTKFNPPALVSRLAFSLGNCTTPASMMVVGGILATVKPGKIISGLVAYFTFIRLILIPLLVMGALFFLRPDPMLSGISVILSGMPAAATTSLLAEKYGADKELASRITFSSTILSIVTAPLLAWLLQRMI